VSPMRPTLKTTAIVGACVLGGYLVANQIELGRIQSGEVGPWEARIVLALGLLAGTWVGLKVA
jgi:hypothetical protein